MPLPFPHTTRALLRDKLRFGWVLLAAAAALLLCWTAWSFAASVSVYESTDEASMEVERAAHLVQVAVGGVVTEVNLPLGASVRAGDVLVELDTRAERLRVEELEAQAAALRNQLEAMERELEASALAMTEELEASREALAAARAEGKEAKFAAELARKEAAITEELVQGGNAPRAELERQTAESEQREASATARGRRAQSLESGGRLAQRERQILVERLRQRRAELEGQLASMQSAKARLEHEIELKIIRSPIDGRLGEITTLRVGGVVEPGARIASIVPDGELRVIALFPPRALGRVKPEQTGRLRLAGFSWLQYGSIPLRVTNVASEVRDGTVRVELEPLAQDDERASGPPRQHGLRGTVEVEVEQVSPAALVLRAAGKWLQPDDETSDVET